MNHIEGKCSGGPLWCAGEQVWLVITGCHLCVGLTPASEGLEQYDHD